MKKIRFALIVGSFLLLAALAVALWPVGREPVYQGRPLSEWVEAYHTESVSRHGALPTAEPSAATIAIQSMGSNALPHLLRWVEYQPGLFRKQSRRLMKKLPASARNSRFGLWFQGQKEFLRGFSAPAAFAALGTNAIPAIPRLAQLLHEAPNDSGKVRAIMALVGIGQQGLPPLLNYLPQARYPLRNFIFVQLELMQVCGADVSPAVPLLLRSMGDQNNDRVETASGVICFLHPDFAVVLPTVLSGLTNVNPLVRQSCVKLAGYYGGSATTAVPALIPALQDQDFYVRQATTKALLKISPQQSAKMFSTH